MPLQHVGRRVGCTEAMHAWVLRCGPLVWVDRHAFASSGSLNQIFDSHEVKQRVFASKEGMHVLKEGLGPTASPIHPAATPQKSLGDRAA